MMIVVTAVMMITTIDEGSIDKGYQQEGEGGGNDVMVIINGMYCLHPAEYCLHPAEYCLHPAE